MCIEREREKVDFKSREVNCLKECALALSYRVTTVWTDCADKMITILNAPVNLTWMAEPYIYTNRL